MSLSAAHDVKEQVRNAVDIVDLVGGYLELRRQGRIYVATCPWHDDTRPSLQVNPERQSWKCWVCDIGGDVFSFVMQREGVEFREALTMLAERAGIEMRQRRVGIAGGPDDKQTLFKVVAWAEQQFHEFFMRDPEADVARRYLADRGVTQSSIERFKLGFSPDHWQWILDRAHSAGMSADVLESVGLVGRAASGRLYDRFKGRVMFPIRDPQNRPIAFGGRVLPELADDKAAKYVNSPETRLFSKSHQLYGLNVVRDQVSKKRHAIVVEGYTDAIAAFQHGVDNVVAVLGTALGAGHVHLLRRFADTVTLVLDGDEAGQRRTNEVLELFVAHQLDLRVVTLPEGMDPCEFLDAHGIAAFHANVADAADALDHRIRIATRGIDLTRETHRANQALEDILSTLSKAPSNHLDAGQARLRQQQIIARLSREFRIDEMEIRTRIKSLRAASSRSPQRRTDETPAGREYVLDNWERALFELLTQRPELADQALATVPQDELRSAAATRLWQQYVAFCRSDQLPEFGRILTALEDPALKSLLVEIDEDARRKSFPDPNKHLNELCDAFQRRIDDRQSRELVSAIEKKELSEEEQLSFLHDLIEKQRRKHGTS